jgi:hypothetical protein
MTASSAKTNGDCSATGISMPAIRSGCGVSCSFFSLIHNRERENGRSSKDQSQQVFEQLQQKLLAILMAHELQVHPHQA